MVSSRKFSYSCKVQWPEKLIERKIQRVKRLQNESSESSGYFFWWIIKTLWIVNSKWKYKVLNITSPKINGMSRDILALWAGIYQSGVEILWHLMQLASPMQGEDSVPPIQQFLGHMHLN